MWWSQKTKNIHLKSKIFGTDVHTDVRTYGRTYVRVGWRQYPIRSELRGVKRKIKEAIVVKKLNSDLNDNEGSYQYQLSLIYDLICSRIVREARLNNQRKNDVTWSLNSENWFKSLNGATKQQTRWGRGLTNPPKFYVRLINFHITWFKELGGVKSHIGQNIGQNYSVLTRILKKRPSHRYSSFTAWPF